MDANKGHAFGILLALVGALQSLRSFRRRLPWALGGTSTMRLKPRFIPICVIIIGLAAIATGIFFLATGVSAGGLRAHLVVSQAADPGLFWIQLAFWFGIGGFFVYTGLKGCAE